MFVLDISEIDKSIKSTCLIDNSIGEVLSPRKIFSTKQRSTFVCYTFYL